jgi:hypothetical protein
LRLAYPPYGLAEDFDKRSGALMADGRRTLADISRAVNNLDRNPTRLLFGPAKASALAPVPAPAAANEKKRQQCFSIVASGYGDTKQKRRQRGLRFLLWLA